MTTKACTWPILYIFSACYPYSCECGKLHIMLISKIVVISCFVERLPLEAVLEQMACFRDRSPWSRCLVTAAS